MARTVKSKLEIKSIIEQYQKVFMFYLKEDITVPKPRLTPTISESLVYHLLKEKVILKELNILSVDFSKEGGDLVVSGKIKVEVKSTGASAFQYFTEKDMKADYIVWVHFGNMLHNNNADLYIIEGKDLRDLLDSGKIPKSKKISLEKMKKILHMPKPTCEVDFFTYLT
jgi:hypothetical protein